jgi:hypothetical protein
MTPTSNEQAAHEIAKLEQELENLERAYAALEQGTWWAKQAFFVFIAALIAMALWGVLFKGNLGFAALLLAMIFAFVSTYTRGRWIDTLSGSTDNAVELEAQIARWKARLAALRGERSGDAGEVGVGKVVGLIPPPSSTGTFGRSGYGGLLHRIGNDPLLIIITTIIVGLLGFLLVQKYNDCMERGGKACPLYCDHGKCRLPYGAPEPLSKEPPAGPTRSSGAGL